MKTVIIDDEKQSRDGLRNLLGKYSPEVEVIGTASNVKEGLDLLGEFSPQLLFLDIEMPDGTGFDLLQKIEAQNYHIVFITAFNQYAIEAIKFGALDYVLKPIDKEKLLEAMERVNSKRLEEDLTEQYRLLLEALKAQNNRNLPTRFAIPTQQGILYKEVKDIVRFEGARNYTEITFTNSTKKIVASVNLGEYEQQFKRYPYIVRTHKSHIVNLYFVVKYVKAKVGYLILNNGDHVKVSSVYRKDVEDGLNAI